jgi:hypothetical protein
MKPEIVVEDSVSREGLRRLHIMGAAPVEAEAWRENGYIPRDAVFLEEKRWEEVRLHHWQVTWMAREVVGWTFQANPLARRMVVLWHIGTGKVSKAILDGAVAYAIGLGRDPLFAYLRVIPAGASEETEVRGIMLVQADWVPDGFVMLDGGSCAGLPKFRVVAPALAAKQLKLEA